MTLFAQKAEDSVVLALRPEIAVLIQRGAAVRFDREGDFASEPEILPGTAGWEEKGLQPDPHSGGPRAGRSSSAVPTVSTRSYEIRIDPDDPLVKKYVALYSGPLRDRTQSAFDRMGRYMEMVTQAIREENLPRELIYLPVVESEYQTFAVSRAGAEGMWQFMRGTAKYAGLKVNYWVDERRDPEKSTRAALRLSLIHI